MDWEKVKNDLEQFGERVKEKWHLLTDDDLDYLRRGEHARFITAIGERYGLSSTHITHELEAIAERLGAEGQKGKAQESKGRPANKAEKKDQHEAR